MQNFTKEQARLILEAHEIYQTLEDDEEIELLEDNNPGLLEAYFALHRFAHGCDESIQGTVPDGCDNGGE